MKLDFEQAGQVLNEEATRAVGEPPDARWVDRLREALAAADKTNRTFVAALGTGILAKATNLQADPLALKVKGSAPGSHSARALAKEVLVPLALELGVDLGVTGREPLNNQPFFRYDFISVDMDVRANARSALALLVDVLDAVSVVTEESEARAILRTFLTLRRKTRREFVATDGPTPASPAALVELISAWVAAASEGGRRSQAVVYGLYSAVYGARRVLASRVNDPDRNFPGDVAVLSVEDGSHLAEVIEVRDKPVPYHDAVGFLEKAASQGCDRATIVAAAPRQLSLDLDALAIQASSRQMAVRVRNGWNDVVNDYLFATPHTIPEACAAAYTAIGNGLANMDVSELGIASWVNWRGVPDRLNS